MPPTKYLTVIELGGTRFDQMRDLARALAVILAIIGVVWILQGLDFYFVPRSFMTGDRIWVLWGVVAVLLAGTLMWMGGSRRK